MLVGKKYIQLELFSECADIVHRHLVRRSVTKYIIFHRVPNLAENTFLPVAMIPLAYF